MTAVEKEIWESQVDGRTSVSIEDARGKIRTETVLGKGQRLRLTRQERELVEERIRDDNQELNPFRNGTLVHMNRPDTDDLNDAAVRSEQEMTDENLVELFDLDEDDFAAGLPALSEVNIRRLKSLATEKGSPAKASHVAALAEHIESHYPIGGDTPTYREMTRTPESATS